jgi:uroporphyrinogen-III synthase
VDTEFDHEDRPVFKTWVSVAKAWNEQPIQLYFQSGNSEDLPDRIVNHVNSIKPQKVFVTKDFKDSDYLPSALKRLKFEVEGKSLIELKEIKIRVLPVTEWIFFSSKHAVKFFFDQKPAIGKVKFGCIGSSTSQMLRTYGHRADFIGSGTDTKLIGKQFSAKVGSSKVLFPIAKDSMRTVQWQMPKQDNAIDLNIYFTVKHSIELDESYTILVFTSPSNVEAYLEKNKILPHQKVIAMGDATEQAFRKLKLKDIAKPITFDDLGLVQAILGKSV